MPDRPSPKSDALPLDGVRVLDLSRLLPGGFCSLLLADFGADVVKVEDTGAGDYVRWMGPTYAGADPSAAGAMFLAWNRNKRSIRLDLKTEQGREALLRLADDADVVLESFRPGVLDRMGVGYEQLAARNPRIVHCAITGYGQDGPYAQRAGHDLNYLALSGMLDLSGEAGGPPVQPAGQIADVGGGALMATIGILVALAERERSGRGQFVDASMLDGAMAWMSGLAARVFAGEAPPERGRLEFRGGLACYRPYACADGWVTLGAIEPKFWEALCHGLDRPDLVPHHLDPADGWAQGQLEGLFRARTREQWARFAAEHECCLEVVLPVEEALEHEQVRARRLIVETDQPGAGTIRGVGVPIRLSRTPGDVRRHPAPALGQHTAEVLREAGYSAEEVAALEASGAAAGPEAPPAA